MSTLVRILLVAALGLPLAALPACGGSSEGSAAGGTGGTSAGPCEPFGSWHVTYDRGTELCAPLSHDIIVAQGDAGDVVVTVVGDGPQQDTCVTPPQPGTYTLTAQWSPGGCELKVASSSSWCQSGEGQCESFDLTLVFSGSTATGSIDYMKCWCPGVSPPKKTFPASAQKS